MDLTSTILSTIASLGGASAVSLMLMKAFGNKLLESQFEKSLETYKFKINSRFDRISKIHEREFLSLPEIWSSIIEANTSFYSLTSFLQCYPDINSMSELERTELYDARQLRQSERIKIESASDKLKEFIEIDYWKKIHDINLKMANFVRLYQSNRIFLTNELEKDIEEIRLKFNSMLAHLDVANINGKIEYDFIRKANENQNELDPIINRVGSRIKERLCFDDAY